MLRCVVEGVVPDVSKDRSSFDLMVKRKNNAFIKALRSSETSGTTPLATRRNIPEVSILQISFSPLVSPQTWEKPNLQSDAATWLATEVDVWCPVSYRVSVQSCQASRAEDNERPPPRPLQIPGHVDKLSPLCIKMSFFRSPFGWWHDFSRVYRKRAGIVQRL